MAMSVVASAGPYRKMMSQRTRLQARDTLRGVTGEFVLESMLGEGGTSEVWLASGSAGEVAVKVLAPKEGGGFDPDRTALRLRNELRALDNVNSDQVVRGLDCGSHYGMPFLVLEYIKGRSLLEWVNTEGFSPTLPWIEALIDSLCAAVAELHGRSVEGVPIAHRDLSPNNFKIVEDAHGVRVKLYDLGIARVGASLTSVGSTAGGTPYYQAPEQLAGFDLGVGLGKETAQMTGPWTDVFTICVILFNLGAGYPYVKGANGAQAEWCRFPGGKDGVARRSVLRSQAEYLPESVQEVLWRGLNPLPTERPGDAAALREDFRKAWARQGSLWSQFKNIVAPTWEVPRLAPPLTQMSVAQTRTSSPEAQGASRSWSDERGFVAEWEIEGAVFRFRWCSPGTFTMGSPEGEMGRCDDEVQHEVTLTRGFWLGETPVTQRQWVALMKENPSCFKSEDRPVEQVNWKDCGRFIDALNGKVEAGKQRFRLPTEAEWEYACRAGTGTATWAGDLEIQGVHNAPLLDAIAWYTGNSGVGFELENGRPSSSWVNKQHPHTRAGTHPVAQKKPNGSGFHDMLGNVQEWCEDALESYPTGAVIDPKGPRPRSGTRPVIRGGSWASPAGRVRAALRGACDPAYRYCYLGFRLARGQGGVSVHGRAESPAWGWGGSG